MPFFNFKMPIVWGSKLQVVTPEVILCWVNDVAHLLDRSHILLCFHLVVYFVSSWQHLTWHGTWALPGLNVPNSIHSWNPDWVDTAHQPVHGKPHKLFPFGLLLPSKCQAHLSRLNIYLSLTHRGSCWKYRCRRSNTITGTNKLCLYKVGLMTSHCVSQHLRY